MTTPLNTLSSKKLLVSPSMLASDFAALGTELKAIEAGGADMVHLDVMDAHFVPNLTIGPALIASLRKHSTLPFDVEGDMIAARLGESADIGQGIGHHQMYIEG